MPIHRNLQISRAPLNSQAQGTSLFTSAATIQMGCPLCKGNPMIFKKRLFNVIRIVL